MPRIKFAEINFLRNEGSSRHDVEARLKNFLFDLRQKAGVTEDAAYFLSGSDRNKIHRRASAYRTAVERASGMSHLGPKEREKLEVLRNGVDLRPVETEHRADEIAGAIHEEMPWMAPATEQLWNDMRTSVRQGDPAPRISPLLLVGPPGIGKSHFARLLGDQLSVPTTVIEATNESASFGVTGSQRGWSSAEAGKPLQTIMAHLVANPIMVIDEVEKAGLPTSTSGRTFDLVQGLLPLLEPMTSRKWPCPFFRINFDMSWITWVLTANSLKGLSAPFLSRCPAVELPGLSCEHLMAFIDREGVRRKLPLDAVDAVKEAVEGIGSRQRLSLRSVIRMLNAVEQTVNRPRLH